MSTLKTKPAKTEETRNPILTALGETALLIICIIPGLFFSFQSLQSPWTMFRIARANLALQYQHIPTFTTSATGYRSEHIGGEIMQVALLEATGWPLESLGLVPLGSLLLALLYYAISKKITRSTWSAAAITLYASWYYPRLYTQFGTQTYAWTNVLFLSFLILLLHWSRNRTPLTSILVMILFTTTFLHYHTTPLWITVAMTVSVAAMKLGSGDARSALRTTVSWALPLFCAILYLGLDTVIYGNALTRLRTEAPGESFMQSFVNKIVTPLLSRSPGVLKAFEVAPTNPRIATWATLCVLLLLIIPAILWYMVKLYKAIRTRDIRTLIHTPEDIFVWVIVLVAIAHALVYSIYGALSLRVVPLAFPLLLPIVAREFKHSKRVETALTSALAFFAIVGFLSFASALVPDTIASETGLATKLFQDGSRVMSDADVYGSMLLNTTEDGKIIDLVWIDSDKYGAVVGQRVVARDDFDWVVVDTSNKPIISSNWEFFEPWTQHTQEIERNDNLNKIYDSDNLTILQPRGADLSTYQLEQKDVDIADRSLFNDALWLFLTTVSVFLVPGAVCALIIHERLNFRIDGLRTLVGLVVGLSISFVTLVGYVVNFTPLGLSWFIPSSVLIPWAALGAYLIFRRSRPRLQLPPGWVTYGLAVLVALLIWSPSATGVAHARTQRRAEFTEFFITQGTAQPGTLVANVVNRLSQPGNFTLIFELDGVEVHTIGPHIVDSNGSWSEKWQVPPVQAGDKLVATLQKDGAPHRELHLYPFGQ